jgi:hypothetical protein
MAEFFDRSPEKVPRVGVDGPCPYPVAKLVDEWLIAAERLRNDKRWHHAKVAKRTSGITVRCLPVDGGSGLMWWRTEFSLRGVRAQDIDAAFQPENRTWDQNPSSHLCRWESQGSATYSIQSQITAPALGGLILGRSFVNLCSSTSRVASDGSVSMTSLSVAAPASLSCHYPPSVATWLRLSAAEGLLLAANLPGSSCTSTEEMLADGSRVVQFCLIAGTEIGGSLPLFLVNNATADALAALVLALTRSMPAASLVV